MELNKTSFEHSRVNEACRRLTLVSEKLSSIILRYLSQDKTKRDLYYFYKSKRNSIRKLRM